MGGRAGARPPIYCNTTYTEHPARFGQSGVILLEVTLIDPNSILGDPRYRKDRQTVEAAWRFQLIAPLLDSQSSKWARHIIRARILTERHDHPWRGPIQVSARTLRRWGALYRQSRLSGLLSQDRRDLGQSRTLPEGSVEAALELLKEDPRRSIDLLIRLLKISNPAWNIARSTLDRHLRRMGRPRKDGIEKGAYLSFQSNDPDHTWQGDIVHGPFIVEGGQQSRAKIVCWLDDHSRYCCHLQAFADERFPVIETSLKRAILKHGRPARVLVDNGSVYSCKSFVLACSQLGIQKVHSAPYHPQSKGKVEKFFQFLRRSLLNEIENTDPLPLEKINRLLTAWLDAYHDRVHKSIKMTPRQSYSQPREHRSVSLQTLEEAFWQWDVRTVSAQGRIDFCGNRYYADLTLVNKQVVIRYDPYDLSRLILWQDGRKLGEATPQELLHQTRPNKNKPKSGKTKSAAADQYLAALEKSQIQRLAQELNLIKLPEEDEEEEA